MLGMTRRLVRPNGLLAFVAVVGCRRPLQGHGETARSQRRNTGPFGSTAKAPADVHSDRFDCYGYRTSLLHTPRRIVEDW
jgi:hypothetical protein